MVNKWRILEVFVLCIILINWSNASLSSESTTDGGLVINSKQLAGLAGLRLDSTSSRNAFERLTRVLKACGLKNTANSRSSIHHRPLTKKLLNSTLHNSTCNDGSPAGYYVRRSFGSRKWIIFLQEGWLCFNKKSCANRWLRSKNLMSSKLWPDSKNIDGILSTYPEENPYWWNSNHVYVPYCSSDLWSGTKVMDDELNYSFMGSYIIQDVIRDLLPQGLFNAKKVYLAGSSAGGTGVLINIDKVADLMSSVGSRADVRGISDSGWFVDNKPFRRTGCSNIGSCARLNAIKKGIKLWSGSVPDKCKLQYSQDEHWKCYLGYRAYPTIQAPIFIIQWLFDEAQMNGNNVGAPVTKAQWNYVHKMGNEVRNTLQNVSALFAPACISHMMLTRSIWQSVTIDGISLPKALRCWEEQKHEHNHHHHHPQHSNIFLRNENSTIEASMLSDMPSSRREVLHRSTNDRRNRMSHKSSRNDSRNSLAESVATNSLSRRHRRQRKHRRRRKNKKRKNRNKKRKDRRVKRKRLVRSLFRASDHEKHRWMHHKNGCKHRLVEQCSWPQCNPTCPKLRNPFTGEQMDFIELLKSFGLNLSGIASALNVDVETLNRMDHGTLLQLLIQQDNVFLP